MNDYNMRQLSNVYPSYKLENTSFPVLPSNYSPSHPSTPSLNGTPAGEELKTNYVLNERGQSVKIEASQTFELPNGKKVNRTIIDNGNTDEIFTSQYNPTNQKYEFLSRETIADDTWKNLENVEPYVTVQERRNQSGFPARAPSR